MWEGHWMPWGASRGEEGGERVNMLLSREEKWIHAPLHHCLSGREAHRRLSGTRRGDGKMWSPWRLVEEAKNGILVKWQKVFDKGFGKQMNSNCHNT